MEYKSLFIRETNFPSLPDELLRKINWNVDEYEKKAPTYKDPNYTWTDDFNTEINVWAQKNIIPGIYYAYQIARADMPIHKDVTSSVKLINVLDTGGEDVWTNFYDEDKSTLLHSTKVPFNKWYILKTDVWHSVIGIERPRFSICSTVFKNTI